MATTTSERERLIAMKRTMRWVAGYLEKMPGQDTLHGDGRGVQTLAELRRHLIEASNIRVVTRRRKKA